MSLITFTVSDLEQTELTGKPPVKLIDWKNEAYNTCLTYCYSLVWMCTTS